MINDSTEHEASRRGLLFSCFTL